MHLFCVPLKPVFETWTPFLLGLIPPAKLEEEVRKLSALAEEKMKRCRHTAKALELLPSTCGRVAVGDLAEDSFRLTPRGMKLLLGDLSEGNPVHSCCLPDVLLVCFLFLFFFSCARCRGVTPSVSVSLLRSTPGVVGFFHALEMDVFFRPLHLACV